MPHLKTFAGWIGPIVAVFSLAACGDRETASGPTERLDPATIATDQTASPAPNAVELNALDTSAQSAALSSATPQETADAGNSVLTDLD